MEEPTIPEDYEGYARIAKEGQIAVAGGENLRTPIEFAHMLSYGQVDFPSTGCPRIVEGSLAG